MPSSHGRLVGRAARIVKNEGVRPLAQRVVRRAYHALEGDALEVPLLPRDIIDPAAVPSEARGARATSAGWSVGWLTTPPSLGSGGHTTMFRMLRAVEDSGVTCVLFLHDRYGGDLDAQTAVIRQGWPEIRAEVRSAADGIRGVDACFATSWDTAHVLVSRAEVTVRRLYFIQDYEPYFYPRGSLYSLAEDSYRLGLRHVALGAMVATTLEAELGVGSEVVPFGCDTETYHLSPGPARSGVVLYSKPTVARRGFIHAKLALEEFHRRHPDQEIHAYGQRVSGLDAPVNWHGRMWPHELNELYNRTLSGLAMSFTNISLVAAEMLAAGNIPVVNDSPLARADLDNPHVAWARPTPTGLADALSRVVEADDPIGRAAAAAASITTGWTDTQAAIVRVVGDEIEGRTAV